MRGLAQLLDCLTRWNVDLMTHYRGRVPPLYSAGVRYKRENYQGIHPEDWRDCLEVVRRGGGDCEDLACYRAAELRMQGEPARAMFVERETPAGGRLFHIVVQRRGGRLEDPSRQLGMNAE